MAMDNEGQQPTVDLEQIKAENASLKALVEQQKSALEKNEGLIGKLRKVESRAERSESIVRDALGAVRIGVAEHFLKTVETLPIETQYELLKAYPRQEIVPPHPPQQGQPQGQQVTPPQPPQGQQQQQPATQPPRAQSGNPRPAAPEIESPFDRDKRALEASGNMNMNTLLALIKRHQT